MRRTPHTSTNPGKHVRLKLMDGTSVDGKFVERTKNKYIILDVDGAHRRFQVRDVDKFIVVKTTHNT
jgi:hypothetical protein